MSHIVTIGVAGLPGVGKTTFISTISTLNIQNIGHLLLESGTIQIDFDEICLEQKPREHWEVIFEAKTGVILLLDSTAPGDAPLMRDIIPLTVPYVIAVTKQDVAGAVASTDLEEVLRHPVLPCITTDETSVKHCLTVLANTILEQMGRV